MPRDPAVDELLADHSDAVVALTQQLRGVVLAAHPQLTERARPGWHSVNYRDPVAGFVCALFPGADRVQLVFEHGARLPDPAGRLSGNGRRVRMLDFSVGDGPDADALVHFLDLAVELGAALRAR
ncbi:DUF1801 domain-containing protein [Blastococcus litoris]|uniref:DUF1801 domain-containing protein n=1 Tax=Blastococcus litoris TaxID=2171622 RepID=UPI0013E052EA|nr:DUF1801 domain-containing protein [Blastococcus litoris]